MRTTILLFLAACLAASCPGRRDEPALRAPLPRSAVTPTASNPIELSLVVQDSVPVGTPVPMTIRVRNAGSGPAELYLRGRSIAFDLVVTEEDGTVVWRRLEGEIVPAVIQLRALDPGEVLELTGTWDQRSDRGAPVAPGSYRVRGAVLRDDPDPLVTPSVPLRIVGP